mmetsp:Transcript_119450/g.211156  ORF Transcript_119450/g.211156 Transcript_119450/m.211156 type:complete len:357 (-) Transcript_119450:177-1247(-)
MVPSGSWLPSLLYSAILSPWVSAELSIPTQTIAPGVEMPTVMIGLWTSGTNEDAKTIVRTWLQQGGTGIDEALVYGNQVEAAQVIKESGIDRSKLFIESKIPGCQGYSQARTWVQQCLEQLHVSYLDLLLIHAPNGPDCLGTWKALEAYHKVGVLKSIGVSNFQVPHLQQLIDRSSVVPAVNQIQYHVFYHDDQVVAFCKQHGITVQSWGPLGGAHHWFKRSVYTEPTIVAIAQAHQVSAAQVALRWVIQHGLTLVFLSGDKSHQRSDADIFEFSLSDTEMSQLDALRHGPLQVEQKSDAAVPSLVRKSDLSFFRSPSGIVLLVVTVSGVILALMRCSIHRHATSETQPGNLLVAE